MLSLFQSLTSTTNTGVAAGGTASAQTQTAEDDVIPPSLETSSPEEEGWFDGAANAMSGLVSDAAKMARVAVQFTPLGQALTLWEQAPEIAGAASDAARGMGAAAVDALEVAAQYFAGEDDSAAPVDPVSEQPGVIRSFFNSMRNFFFGEEESVAAPDPAPVSEQPLGATSDSQTENSTAQQTQTSSDTPALATAKTEETTGSYFYFAPLSASPRSEESTDGNLAPSSAPKSAATVNAAQAQTGVGPAIEQKTAGVKEPKGKYQSCTKAEKRLLAAQKPNSPTVANFQTEVSSTPQNQSGNAPAGEGTGGQIISVEAGVNFSADLGSFLGLQKPATEELIANPGAVFTSSERSAAPTSSPVDVKGAPKAVQAATKPVLENDPSLAQSAPFLSLATYDGGNVLSPSTPALVATSGDILPARFSLSVPEQNLTDLLGTKQPVVYLGAIPLHLLRPDRDVVSAALEREVGRGFFDGLIRVSSKGASSGSGGHSDSRQGRDGERRHYQPEEATA